MLRIVELLESEVLGQSTFGMKGSENVEEEEIIELPIRKTADVIKNITSNTPGKVYYQQSINILLPKVNEANLN